MGGTIAPESKGYPNFGANGAARTTECTSAIADSTHATDAACSSGSARSTDSSNCAGEGFVSGNQMTMNILGAPTLPDNPFPDLARRLSRWNGR
jgi:hypothetical protein